ncbi:hypothetical protein M9H77_06453 [Catharanthus roseus]|uniref:Uncharacterized protein n=1 Tax=Catharanthus roseus TaxID=4058 RepID=A0ACC0BS53_CATRO|nr:hypothetical protein M9H77_06453 [Catharanthus roseus]
MVDAFSEGLTPDHPLSYLRRLDAALPLLGIRLQELYSPTSGIRAKFCLIGTGFLQQPFSDLRSSSGFFFLLFVCFSLKPVTVFPASEFLLSAYRRFSSSLKTKTQSWLESLRFQRKMKVILVQNKIAPAICSPKEYPESWKGEILKEKLGDALSCLTLHLTDNEGLTGENLLVIILKAVPNHERKANSIPVEEETISEPSLDPPQEPETNSESSTPSSSTPVPETSDPILDGSDEEEEHPEAQTQALKDY